MTAQSPSAASPTGTERTMYAVVVLTLVYCFAFVDRQIFNMLVGPIKRDFNVSDIQVGILLGPAFIFSYVALGLPAGWCVDRFNRSRLLILAGIAWGIGTMGAALADSYEALFFSRLFVGASEAFVYPAGMSLIADLYSRRQLPVATSIFITAPSVGGGLALLGGGVLLGMTEPLNTVTLPLFGDIRGWQFTLVIIGLIGLLPILLMTTIRDPRVESGPVEASAAPAEQQYGLVEGTAYMVKRWRFYLTFFFGMSCSSLVMLTTTDWAPTYLAREFGLNPTAIGTRYGSLVLIFGIAGSIASPMINAFMRRFTAYPTMLTVCVGPVMLMIFSSALLFARTEGMALACLAALTFAYIFPTPMASTSLQLVCPPRLRGVAAAYYFVIVSLVGYGVGTTSVPLVTRYVFDDPNKVGEAIAIIGVTFATLCLILVSIAFRGFKTERDEIARNEAAAAAAPAITGDGPLSEAASA